MNNQSIQVTASVAFKAPYLEMVANFEKRTGIQIKTNWLPTVEIVDLIQKGMAGDLVILSGINIDTLLDQGFILANSRINYVSSGIGIGIQKNSLKPKITSQEEFRNTLINAQSIAYSTGPSGVYLKDLFQKMGLSEQLQAKLKIIQGEPVGMVVLRGEAEIGLQQIPEILSVPEIDYLGPLPPELQSITTFAFAIPNNKSLTERVKSLIDTLKSPDAQASIERFGLTPCK